MKFLRIFVKRWYLYALLIVILPAGATLYGRQHLRTYQSSAYILVYRAAFLDSLDSQGYNSYLSPAQNEQNFILELIDSQAFTGKVAADTSLAQIYDLTTDAGEAAAVARIRTDTAVSASQNGPNGLTILVQDKDPIVTQQIAKSLIKQFVSYDANRQLQYDNQAETFYQGQLTTAKNTLKVDNNQVQAYKNAHPALADPTKLASDAQYQQLMQQVTQDTANVTSLSSTITAIQLDAAAAKSGYSNSLTVQDEPSTPQLAAIQSKQLIFYAVLGLVAALVLVIVIVGAQTIVDNKVRSTDDLQTIFDEMDWDAPIVESIPVMPTGAKNSKTSQSTPLVALLGPGSPNDEREGR